MNLHVLKGQTHMPTTPSDHDLPLKLSSVGVMGMLLTWPPPQVHYLSAECATCTLIAEMWLWWPHPCGHDAVSMDGLVSPPG